MFERYSDKARRVIFFARYEASQYGSRCIETEHILLGILREDHELMGKVLGPERAENQIRVEIEEVITIGKRLSTVVEVPLSQESTKVLRLAGEEADGLGHHYVETGHILIGIMRVEGSLAARILMERGVKLEFVRERIVKASGTGDVEVRLQTSEEAKVTLYGFLASLESNNWAQSALFFAKNCQFIDSKGKRWSGREEIEKQFEALFVAYAKRGVTAFPELEFASVGAADCVASSILWENVITPGETMRAMHRMTVILAKEAGEWVISLIQVTPVVVR